MIHSMTGFASVSREYPEGAMTLELRSVNHRYLDIQFRISDELRGAEPLMREKISAAISRGKVECRVSQAHSSGAKAGLSVDFAMLAKLAELNRVVKSKLPQAADLSVSEVLKWPGIFGAEAMPDAALARVLELLDLAINDFAATRAREGEKLKGLLLERVRSMREKIAEVAPRIPALLASFQEKLATRLREALGSSDDERIRQELALFAAKIDVDEELSRLGAHLSEIDRVLQKGGNVGKRLDFLMQELNREANTLGSKSVDSEVSKAAIELKVLIEQMREQIQNIE